MKILKTDRFVSERVKAKPITNAEWDVVKKEINMFRKINNPTFDDIKEGNVVCVAHEGNYYIYIVFDSMKLPPYFNSDIIDEDKYDGNMILMRYNRKKSRYSYRTSDVYKENFPFAGDYHTKDRSFSEITRIYDANINTADIIDCECLRREWEAACEKIANYKQ